MQKKMKENFTIYVNTEDRKMFQKFVELHPAPHTGKAILNLIRRHMLLEHRNE